MLILNDKTISNVLSFEAILTTVEEAMVLYDSGNYTMPDRMHLDMADNTFLLMPCVTGKYFGTKLVSFFPSNPKMELPAIMGTMMLNDGNTGQPLALFDAASLTALRTGAIGGVALRYLAPKQITTIGIIGIGVQGLHQAFFACTSRAIKTIFLLNRNAEKAAVFKAKVKERFPEVAIQICDSLEDLVKYSEAIITATNANDPVLPDNPYLLKGKTIIAVGSYKPTMREMPDALFPLLDKIYVDTLLSKKESGDVAFPLENGIIEAENIKTLGERILSKESPPGGTTLFKSVGMALFDVVTAKAIYERARETGLGLEVDLA